jgi:beta-glucosidase
MSQSDKTNLLNGSGSTALGIASFRFSDGPLGAGGSYLPQAATSLPSGTALAATFNGVLARRYGTVVGAELKHRGYIGAMGPNGNLIREPVGGRGFESYGEDPYLASRMAVGWVEGVQSQGVMAAMKHLVANEQEGSVGTAGLLGSRFYYNAVVDERTLHEIYLAPFEAAVTRGHAAGVMCAFNRVNGTFACADPTLLGGVLRRRWGFRGFVVSDAGAAHETADDLNAGLNWDLFGTAYREPLITAAMAGGRVSQATVDRRVVELLQTLFAYGFFDRAAYVDEPSRDDRPADNAVAERIEEQAITLLKNDGSLPISPRKVRSIAVIGAPAHLYVQGGGSAGVNAYQATTLLDGITKRAAQENIQVKYSDGSARSDPVGLAASSDMAIVVAATSEGEWHDRLCLSLAARCQPDASTPFTPTAAVPGDNQAGWGDQDALITGVAAANKHTVVVLETGAPVLTPWRNRVSGLLEAWFPGQAGGTAVGRVLFGDADPGGRLPVTFPNAEADVPSAGDPKAYPGVDGDVSYKEGVFVGYRWYDGKRLTPAFPFGFGLSYTRFRYSDLRIAASPVRGGAVASVRFVVTNVGTRAGSSAPQLYLELPPPSGSVPQPPRQLKGFAKLQLAPGVSRTVTLPVAARDLSYWNVADHNWRSASGCYGLKVGDSSRHLLLAGTLAVGAASCGRKAVKVSETKPSVGWPSTGWPAVPSATGLAAGVGLAALCLLALATASRPTTSPCAAET